MDTILGEGIMGTILAWSSIILGLSGYFRIWIRKIDPETGREYSLAKKIGLNIAAAFFLIGGFVVLLSSENEESDIHQQAEIQGTPAQQELLAILNRYNEIAIEQGVPTIKTTLQSQEDVAHSIKISNLGILGYYFSKGQLSLLVYTIPNHSDDATAMMQEVLNMAILTSALTDYRWQQSTQIIAQILNNPNQGYIKDNMIFAYILADDDEEGDLMISLHNTDQDAASRAVPIEEILTP